MDPERVSYLIGLVDDLCRLPRETECVEFKRNENDEHEIGEYISALANSAALARKSTAHVVWGVEDDTHEVVGTTFSPSAAKVGNENLENWLVRMLSPQVPFRFHEFQMRGLPVVILEITAASHLPIRFSGSEFVRIGSYKKKLKDHSEKERELWRVFEGHTFEDGVALGGLDAEDVLKMLDYPSYFELVGMPLPDSRDRILSVLKAEELVSIGPVGDWNITNLGAILFAKRLDDFKSLRRRAVRVISYRGDNKVETIRELLGTQGYASGFKSLVEYINGALPSNELIQQALRRTVPMYPELAVRELVANALIHQDFSVTGAGPIVEIFESRMEVTNPGKSLVDTERLLDAPPRSRNERLASLMRRLGICEERGSGIDKIVFEMEFFQLPAPLFETPGDSTRAVLLAPRSLTKMDKGDRIRACYLHACLRYVGHEYLTNTSVRARFGIESQNLAVASRLIREAVTAGAIVLHDKGAAPKYMKYVPFWAEGASGT